LKRAAAGEVMKAENKAVAKYDKDKDGMLNKKEIEAYAKGEFKFAMPSEATALVIKACFAGEGKGVKLADSHRLKCAVGVARERARDLERRKVREEKEAALKAKKEELQKAIDEAAATSKEAEEKTNKVGQECNNLFSNAKTLKSQEMTTKASEFEELVSGAKESVEEALKSISELGADEEDLEVALKTWLNFEKKKLDTNTKKLNNTLTRANGSLTRFKDEATKKEAAELKELTSKALKIIRKFQASKGLSSSEMFKEFGPKGDSVQPAEFVAFFEKRKDDKPAEGEEAKEEAAEPLSEDDLQRVFTALDDEDEDGLSEDRFRVLLRVLKKVVNDIVLTDNKVIKESKVLRRMDIGEVVEVLEGPVKEGELVRVRGRAVKDDVEGWLTVNGNQGTVFLEDGGGDYKVVKETILTEAFEIGATKEETKKSKVTTRKLKVGEIITVREWEKKDEGTGLTRMKVKVQLDGLVGFVTSMGNTGIKFVEPC